MDASPVAFLTCRGHCGQTFTQLHMDPPQPFPPKACLLCDEQPRAHPLCRQASPKESIGWVRQGCSSKVPLPVALKQQTFISSQFWGLEV